MSRYLNGTSLSLANLLKILSLPRSKRSWREIREIAFTIHLNFLVVQSVNKKHFLSLRYEKYEKITRKLPNKKERQENRVSSFRKKSLNGDFAFKVQRQYSVEVKSNDDVPSCTFDPQCHCRDFYSSSLQVSPSGQSSRGSRSSPISCTTNIIQPSRRRVRSWAAAIWSTQYSADKSPQNWASAYSESTRSQRRSSTSYISHK
jgi:hypothetical protein